MTLLLPPYNIGTATVAHGATTVAFSGGAIITDTAARELDTFTDPVTGAAAFVRSVTDTSHIVIGPWPGSSLAGAGYAIEKTSPLRFVGADAMADVQRMLDDLNETTIIIPVPGSVPDPSLGEEGWYALKSNAGAWQLWLKTGGTWVLQSQPVGLTYRNEWSGATNYVVNDRVSRNGISYTAKQNNTNHDPATDSTFVYWDAGGAKGDPGADGKSMLGGIGAPSNALGINGDRYLRKDTDDVYLKASGIWSIDTNIRGDVGPAPVIAGTSTSVVTVGTGSKTFATQSGIAWLAGMRLRAVNAGGDRVMVGLVSSYAGGSLVLAVDTTQGVGADNTWSIHIAGEVGQQGGAGPSGGTGTQGIQGIQGIPGAASTVPGPKGDTGTGLAWNASGTLAQRSTYDGQTTGYAFLETDIAPARLWVKASNTSADWAGPFLQGGTAAVGDWGSIADSVLEIFDYGSIAA